MLTAVLLVLRNRTYVPPADTDIPFTAEDMPSGALIRRTSENGETPESYNFLVLGVDRVASLADTVMIISLKTDGGISVVQLPRDIYVDRESAGLDGDGGIKLNSLYAALGAERFAAFLSGSLCVKIDYSLTVGTDVFAIVRRMMPVALIGFAAVGIVYTVLGLQFRGDDAGEVAASIGPLMSAMGDSFVISPVASS